MEADQTQNEPRPPLNETDQLKAELADAAGYSGKEAEAFISALRGDSPEELATSAAKIVDFAASMKPKVYATDPSQGYSGPDPRKSPAKMFAKVIDRTLLGPRDPWSMSSEFDV
jgi:hypothetical protein